MKPTKGWLVDRCAMCGQLHPWSRSKLSHIKSRQLLCLCERRESPQPVRTQKNFSELTQAEIQELIKNVSMPEPGKGGLPIDL